MNYRINRKAVALVVVLVGIAGALFAWTLVTAPTDVEEETTPKAKVVADETSRLITAKHQYRGGIHTIAGLVDLPTPCHKLVVEPFITEPNKKVELRFATTIQDENCIQTVTPTPFKVTFEAPEGVEVTGVWDSAPVRINLVPIGPDESIDDAAYMKG